MTTKPEVNEARIFGSRPDLARVKASCQRRYGVKREALFQYAPALIKRRSHSVWVMSGNEKAYYIRGWRITDHEGRIHGAWLWERTNTIHIDSYLAEANIHEVTA